MNEDYRVGIEEEYFLVHSDTKAVRRTMPAAFYADVQAALGPQVKGELLQGQIEVATRPHTALSEARDELRAMRRTVAAIATRHGLSVLAAGTHPTASWPHARQTQEGRYDAVMHDLQMLGRRNMLCGLHVHVEPPDVDLRVDLMRRLLPAVPVFVALATSSPFWRSERTGLMGYRLAAYDELPRTGLPELFDSTEDYEDYVEALVGARAIEDSSFVWWTLRPSLRHPTLELRAPDSCTRVEDSIAIAALYRSLMRHLVRHPEVNASLDAVDRAIAAENKWRAQRYGIHGTFVDRQARKAVPISEIVEDLVARVSLDAAELGCLAELAHLHTILADGTSADIQISLFEEAAGRTGDRTEALKTVKTWLVAATLQ